MWPTGDHKVKLDKHRNPVLTPDGRLDIPIDYPKLNCLIYSLETFTPLLQLDQGTNWRPNANRGKPRRILRIKCNSGALLRTYLWIHIIAGWVLTSLWVGAITGLVKS